MDDVKPISLSLPVRSEREVYTVKLADGTVVERRLEDLRPFPVLVSYPGSRNRR